MVLVRKKYGSWIMCIDYLALNKANITDNFHIPLIIDLFDELVDERIFYKLDLILGYHQIRMKEEDIYKTASRPIHGDHYEYVFISHLQTILLKKMVSSKIQHKKKLIIL